MASLQKKNSKKREKDVKHVDNFNHKSWSKYD